MPSLARMSIFMVNIFYFPFYYISIFQFSQISTSAESFSPWLRSHSFPAAFSSYVTVCLILPFLNLLVCLLDVYVLALINCEVMVEKWGFIWSWIKSSTQQPRQKIISVFITWHYCAAPGKLQGYITLVVVKLKYKIILYFYWELLGKTRPRLLLSLQLVYCVTTTAVSCCCFYKLRSLLKMTVALINPAAWKLQVLRRSYSVFLLCCQKYHYCKFSLNIMI